jgi:hypothetical protein
MNRRFFQVVGVKKYIKVSDPQKKSAQNDGTESENGNPFAIIVKKRCQDILHAHLSSMVYFDAISYLKIVFCPISALVTRFGRGAGPFPRLCGHTSLYACGLKRGSTLTLSQNPYLAMASNGFFFKTTALSYF